MIALISWMGFLVFFAGFIASLFMKNIKIGKTVLVFTFVVWLGSIIVPAIVYSQSDLQGKGRLIGANVGDYVVLRPSGVVVYDHATCGLVTVERLEYSREYKSTVTIVTVEGREPMMMGGNLLLREGGSYPLFESSSGRTRFFFTPGGPMFVDECPRIEIIK